MQVIPHQLHQVVAAAVVGPQHSRGMHHHRVQAPGGGVQHQLGSGRLAAGIAPVHGGGGEALLLADQLARAAAGQGVDRADVQQAAHPGLLAHPHHVGGAPHVHLAQGGQVRPGDIHHPGGVDYVHRPVPQVLKQGPQAGRVGDVSLHIGDVPGGHPLLAGQPQAPHRRSLSAQLPHQGAAQVAAGPGDDIQPFHRHRLRFWTRCCFSLHSVL